MPKDSHEHNYHNLTRIIILAVILLSIGQVVLYRNIQSVKSMISETSMELKEGKGVKTDADKADPTGKPAVQNTYDTPKK